MRISSSFGGGILRVLHVLPAGEFGGAESQILALLGGLSELGIDGQVATYFDGEFAAKARAAGFATDVLMGGGMRRDLRALEKRIGDTRPDILHTHGVRASLVGRWAGKRLGIPVVTTVHSDLHYDYAAPVKRFLFMRLEAATRGMSERIIAVSGALGAILRQRGYDPARLVVIPNGMDTKRAADQLAAAADQPAHLREQLGLPADALIILCVARLHPVKRHDVLIDAVEQVERAAECPVHLVLTGDGALRAQLQEQAERVAPGRVHFLGARSDVFALLREADVFALTSQMEGLPIALLEAMFAGVAVVATRVGGMVEVVEGGNSAAPGVLVPPADADALAVALSRLLSDAQLRKQMGQAGRERALSRYSLHSMAQAVAGVYQDVQSRR